MQKPTSVQEAIYERMNKMRSDKLRSFSKIIKHLMDENQRLTEENQKIIEEMEIVKSTIGKWM
jgi:predicted CopG family antitoxin